MVILIKKILSAFAYKHPDTALQLNDWYNITKEANWNKPADIKRDFNNVDYVGNDRYVFNIKGNHYRLVAMIFLINGHCLSALLGHTANMIT